MSVKERQDTTTRGETDSWCVLTKDYLRKRITIHVLSFDVEPSKQTHNVTMTTVSLVKSRSTHAKSINLPLRRQSVTLIYRVSISCCIHMKDLNVSSVARCQH